MIPKLEGTPTEVTRRRFTLYLQLQLRSKDLTKSSKSNISDALWGSVLAGLGGVFVEALLVGSFYFFDPIARISVANNAAYFRWSVPGVFLAGLGLSLQLMLKTQLWRGKWE